jgi:predicted phage tail component-like protein
MHLFGLTFNGKHSFNDMGLILLSKDRPILPEPKEVTEDIPGADGEYDYSQVNSDNEQKYKPRVQEITFAFDRNNINWRDPRVIRQAARKIAAWLGCGESTLTFDDEADKQEYAKVNNKLDLENQIESGRPFTAQFRCRSFPCQIDSVETLMLDSKILLDSNLRLGDEFQFAVTGNTTVIVNNFGTHSIKPTIEITGSFTSITIAVGNKSITYSEAVSSKTIILDCAVKRASDGDTNKNNKLTGDFITLPVGVNSVQITGTGINCTVIFRFRPLYY